jgi:hypothetical protein
MEPTPWHPDAEQLTAFAEQALPRHEREQTLAHLAVCGACRATVFLAQQAGPEAAPQRVPARRPWFAGWNLVWPAVAALAAVAGFGVFLRHSARVERPAPPVAVAQVKPEQPLPAAATVPAPQLKLPPQPKQSPAAAAQVAAGKMPPPPAPPPPPALAAESEIHGALPLPKPALVLSGASGSLAGPGGGQQAAAVPVNLPPQETSVLASDANNALAQGASQAAPLARLQAPPPAPQPQGPPPPVLAQPQVRQNDAVTVEATAAALSDIPATSDNSAKFAALLPELPSHLETVSSISNGMATVAVDAGGAVFESRDEGKHWKTVEAPWSGRPVKVALEESRAAGKRPASAAAPVTSRVAGSVAGSTAEDALDRRRTGAGEQAELHGTVTDQSGAVIPGAKVQVRAGGATGDGRTTQADGQGRFAVPGLAAGRYQVVVSSPGFATLTRVLTLDAGVETGMNATLVVGAMTETVTVESNEPGPKIPGKAKAPAFQLTTDTGAVWVSSDGRSWKRR